MEGLPIKGRTTGSILTSRRPLTATNIIFLALSVSPALLLDVAITPNSVGNPDNHYE